MPRPDTNYPIHRHIRRSKHLHERLRPPFSPPEVQPANRSAPILAKRAALRRTRGHQPSESLARAHPENQPNGQRIEPILGGPSKTRWTALNRQ
jgi:hypothetical protein